MIEKIKETALENKVPIIKDEGLAFILAFIKEKGSKNILELGTAVGYSSINMAKIADDIKIDTIEKNEEMYKQALENIASEHLENQITVHFSAIEDFKTEKQYDLIFVDAAKAQYKKYTEQFLNNLKPKGYLIYDNMVFHNLIYDVDNIKSRNKRSLVKKILNFRETIRNDERFDIMFYDSIGDGLLVVTRRLNGR